MYKFTGAARVSLRMDRPVDELAGWHGANLYHLLPMVEESEWPQYLAYYLRALKPEVLESIAQQATTFLPNSGQNKAIAAAISIIQEDDNGER